jgi:hypothetical protein
MGVIFYDGSTTGTVYLAYSCSGNAFTKIAGNAFGNLDASDTISFDFEIPVAEWAGSGTVNLAGNDVEYASSNGTAVVFTQAGSTIPTTTPSGSEEDVVLTGAFANYQSSDFFVLEAQRGGAGPWMPPGGEFDKLRFDGTNYIGAEAIWSGTSVVIRRGKYAYGTSGAWSSLTSGTRWRVRKVSASSVAGFEMASATSAGLLSRYTEGTWTPAETSKGNLTGTSTFGAATYTRIGNTVFARIETIAGLTTSSTGTTYIEFSTTGLPGDSNGRYYFGSGYIGATGGALTASVIRSGSGSTYAVLIWSSQGSTLAQNIQSVSFQYTV